MHVQSAVCELHTVQHSWQCDPPPLCILKEVAHCSVTASQHTVNITSAETRRLGGQDCAVLPQEMANRCMHFDTFAALWSPCSLLQAEQPQLFQPVLIGSIFHPLDHFCGLLLDALQHVRVSPADSTSGHSTPGEVLSVQSRRAGSLLFPC